MPRPAFALVLPSLLLAGCQPGTRPAAAPPVTILVEVEEPEAWRAVATAAGAAAIEGLEVRWAQALADARRRGAARAIAAEGALLDPSVALTRAAPAPGPYRCRLLRVAPPGGARMRGLAVPRAGFCFVGVEGEQLSLTSEMTGHRMGGYLYEGRGTRDLVFLGAAAPARGRAAGYGEDPARDVAGRFERVDEFRYRLVVPAAAAPELQVFELIPAPRP